MSKCKLYKNNNSAFTEFLNTNNSQLNKFTRKLTIEPMERLKLAIYLKRVFIFEDITDTGAEKFVVHIRHIHVNVARKELHLSFLLSI